MSEDSYTLRELDAYFVVRIDAVHRRQVDTLAEADGIMFQCPKCYKKNGGPVGTHSVMCWFESRVPDEETPGPGRWTPTGTTIDDLSFVPTAKKSNSVLLTGGCGWHGLVQNGRVTLT